MTAVPEEENAQILVVDDDREIRCLLLEMLSRRAYRVLEAISGSEALQVLNARDDIDLVLLDLNIPELNGYDVLRAIKQNSRTAEIPVIFLSARSEAQDKIAGLELGAVDYVAKPFNLQELLARVAGALRAKATLDRLRTRSSELEHLSLTDPLTGLFNRRYLEQRLRQEMERARRDRAWLSCLMLDVDHFKSINDRYGHPSGDAVLREIARILRAGVRAVDTVARFGGEEFVVLLPRADPTGARAVAEGLRQAVAGSRIRLEESGCSLAVTVSIGWASYDGKPGGDPELVERADAALLEAKRNGRNRVVGAEQDG